MIEWRASFCLISLVWGFFVQRVFGSFSCVWLYWLNKRVVVFQLCVCRLTVKIWHREASSRLWSDRFGVCINNLRTWKTKLFVMYCRLSTSKVIKSCPPHFANEETGLKNLHATLLTTVYKFVRSMYFFAMWRFYKFLLKHIQEFWVGTWGPGGVKMQSPLGFLIIRGGTTGQWGRVQGGAEIT